MAKYFHNLKWLQCGDKTDPPLHAKCVVGSFISFLESITAAIGKLFCSFLQHCNLILLFTMYLQWKVRVRKLSPRKDSHSVS